MESYIDDKKNLYSLIHELLDESEESNDYDIIERTFHKLDDIIKSQKNEGDGSEMLQFLQIIKSIGEYHYRNQCFNERLNQLLLHFKDQINQSLSNLEIFHIFENNKKIVLFLLTNGILTISDEIYNEMICKIENNGNQYCHFFIPELENFAGEEKMKFIKDELVKSNPNYFDHYEKKRQEGENDSYICFLIRQDSVQEFISHMNHYNISPSSQISLSIFETNPFLIDNKNTTLIEYAAFFGSIQIFKYLEYYNAELKPSVWLYAIHSKNAELINDLELNQALDKNYEQFLIEFIKCHHNDIADYFESHIKNQAEKDSQQNKRVISNCIKYYNYSHFENDEIFDHCFFYLHLYHYDKLFKLLLKKKQKSIEKKIIRYPDIETASKNNDTEVIYHHLLKMKHIYDGLFTFKQNRIGTIVEVSFFNTNSNSFFCNKYWKRFFQRMRIINTNFNSSFCN